MRLEGMKALGWVEGSDYTIDARYAEGVSQALPDLAARLIATQPDIFLPLSDPTARVLTARTPTPVVFTITRVSIGSRLAESLHEIIDQ